MEAEKIDGIAANLNGEFPQKHAVHVRPVGDRFQLISGHHRTRAAVKRGLERVWAWVEELDDETAFMELALSNNQGELSPLEIGLHALKAVPTGKRGRGNKGDGLKAYAAKLGKGHSTVSEYRSAAEVLEHVKDSLERTFFLDKAKHLAAIHKLPQPAWQPACEHLAAHPDLSAKDVAGRVDEVNRFLEDVPQTEHARKYLCEDGAAALSWLICMARDLPAGLLIAPFARRSPTSVWALVCDTPRCFAISVIVGQYPTLDA